MGVAALYGVGSGALHAVTGPDHVLSLGPAALREPRQSFGIGLRWGIGHALGTLLLSVPLVFAAHLVELRTVAAFGDRLSALALLLMGIWSFRSLRRNQRSPDGVDHRQPLVIGLIHGIAGAGSLVLLLPVVLGGALETTLLFLVAFAAGSTFAMATLTSLLAKLGTKLARSALPRAQRLLASLSIGLGAIWLVA
jgi:hypothetical protein